MKRGVPGRGLEGDRYFDQKARSHCLNPTAN
jgi:hypothetical protein